MNIYRMNDCDWVVAETAEQAASFYQAECGPDPDLIEDGCPYQLTDELLDCLQFQDCDENEEWIGEPRTFREQLAIEVAAAEREGG